MRSGHSWHPGFDSQLDACVFLLSHVSHYLFPFFWYFMTNCILRTHSSWAEPPISSDDDEPNVPPIPEAASSSNAPPLAVWQPTMARGTLAQLASDAGVSVEQMRHFVSSDE